MQLRTAYLIVALAALVVVLVFGEIALGRAILPGPTQIPLMNCPIGSADNLPSRCLP